MVKVLAAAVALVMTTGTAFAVMGKTNTDVALRTAPAAQAGVILNLPKGAIVNVGRCSSGWCGVTFNKHGGYVRESALQFQSTPISGPPAIPVYPPYPYKAGHYPTADAYYDLPPYAAINPSFYRWRFFLMAQERNRYRYMPDIFRGYTGYREDTVGSYVSSSELVSKPMSPKSPTKAEPSPTGPSGVSEPNAKKEDAGSSIEPSPPGSTSPRASSKKSELTPAPQPLKSGSAVVAVTPTAPIPSALPVHVAQDPILARVNDTDIKQSDLDSTASDLGSRLVASRPWGSNRTD